MRVPPPIIFLAFIINGLVFQEVAPVFTHRLPELVAQTAGLLLIVFAAYLIWWAIREFRKGANAPDGWPRELVTNGPYRYSRNPMYLSAAILQLGLAIFLQNLWMVIMLIPAITLVTAYTVIPEERKLEERYGQDYRDYKQSVKRWI